MPNEIKSAEERISLSDALRELADTMFQRGSNRWKLLYDSAAMLRRDEQLKKERLTRTGQRLARGNRHAAEPCGYCGTFKLKPAASRVCQGCERQTPIEHLAWNGEQGQIICNTCWHGDN